MAALRSPSRSRSPRNLRPLTHEGSTSQIHLSDVIHRSDLEESSSVIHTSDIQCLVSNELQRHLAAHISDLTEEVVNISSQIHSLWGRMAHARGIPGPLTPPTMRTDLARRNNVIDIADAYHLAKEQKDVGQKNMGQLTALSQQLANITVQLEMLTRRMTVFDEVRED